MRMLRQLVCSAWAAQAFAGFTARDRGRLLAAAGEQAARVADAVERGGGFELAATLLHAAARVDDGTVWHPDLGLRSYVDVSLQVRALRAFIAWTGADPLATTELVLACFPDARPALLLQAELLLERGEPDRALPAIERALRIQAVCPLAQRLLAAARGTEPDLRDRFCPVPFTTLSTGYQGGAFVCSCPAWVPYPVGNVLEAGSAEELWNSEVAVEIRRSVLDGDFRHCSRTLCALIAAGKLPARDEIDHPVLRGYIERHTTRLPAAPHMVDLNYDSACNLACPSCRTEIISSRPDEQAAYDAARDRVILPLLRGVQGRVYISGGGEAFASKHTRSILRALNRDEYPRLSVFLITNGLLVTPERWSRFPRLGEMVATLAVSVDAARAETYERLRPPGKWATLMANLEFIAGLRRAGKIPAFWINFVVQKANFREMLDFVALGDRLGVDKVWFQRVTNYGAYDEATFRDVDVTSPSHPDHAELLELLRHPLMRRPGMNVYMLMSLAPDVFADSRWEQPVIPV